MSPTENREVLAVDIGNSRIKAAVFRSGAMAASFEEPTKSAKDAAAKIGRDFPHALVAMSSVVPEAADSLELELTSMGIDNFRLESGKSSIISSLYSTLGADRIANMVAAWKLYGKERNTAIIDLGTATTLTTVSKDGHFMGGYITLGLGKSLSSLHESAAQLPKAVLGSSAERQLAFDTEASIVSGTLLGHVGIVEHWLKIARRCLGNEMQAIATGGWCELVARHTLCFDNVDPLLTLRGIYLIAEEEAALKDRA